MLARLSIRDIVLIDQLDLDFSRGLTILTGETGAGKSILLDSLSLALGARGDGALVRHGQAQGQVTAVFDVPAGHSALEVLAANDIPIESELIFRRVQVADGRTRAYVNDQSVSAQTLRAIAAHLVEIHGGGAGSGEQIDLKRQAAVARIIVDDVLQRRVGNQAAVPIELTVDPDGWKSRRQCRRTIRKRTFHCSRGSRWSYWRRPPRNERGGYSIQRPCS